MKIDFRRIISRGSFIPQIDGLRFIAITSVVVYHLNRFLSEKDLNNYTSTYDFNVLSSLLSHGHLGVPLFFVISGFILTKPFADLRLNNGPHINIGYYFVRRLTRLEPPYILAMTVLLFGATFVSQNITWENGIYSYLSSISYTHNFFYGKSTLPLLNAVAWSLEIEIQFYILTPLLTTVFLVKNKFNRRLIIISATIFIVIIDHFETLAFISIVNYLEYFLVGLLLADMYIVKSVLFKRTKFDLVLSISVFILIWLFEVNELESLESKILWDAVQLSSIFLLYYLVLFHNSIKFLANPIITNVGGMCYSIYLLHYPLISLFGNPLLKITFSNDSLVNTLFYSFILISVVVGISSIYFLMIERPCMAKDWHKKILN